MAPLMRPKPSLVRRLTIAFLLSNAGVGLFFVSVALYPAALVEDDEPLGPELVQLYLVDHLEVDPIGHLALKPSRELNEFVETHPGTWFVARTGYDRLEYGPVPRQMRKVDVDHINTLGTSHLNQADRGALDAIYTDRIDVEGRQVTLTSGGVASRDITFGQFLTYSWRSQFFLAPLLVALFNLAGGIIAIPVVLRALRPTVDAAAALDPSDLSVRLPEDGVVKELEPLVNAFNGALERVAEDFERRRRFMADVSHELRTPLAVLNMHVEELPASNQKAELQRTVFRLGQMVGQMLDTQRLVMADRRREGIDLVELARTAVADIAPLAIANGYKISVVSDVDRLKIEGDRHSITRALANLLGNAVAHGGGRGTIEVRVSLGGAIDVIDQGPGIDPAARERIFEPFHREGWDKDGCGLGLYLVRQVMQAHGGKAFALPWNQGAAFRLQFCP